MTRLNDEPIDPARHRAQIAAIFASLPATQQRDAADVVADWPRLIHFLAKNGALATPAFATEEFAQ
jgi:hypothetical protein